MKVNRETYMTAITRRTASAPVKWLASIGLLDEPKILDYGCGKGKDAEFLGCAKYDPYYQAKMPKGKYDRILCTYVLNTIKNDEQKLAIIDDIQFRLKLNGFAYITVRRDVKKAGYTAKKTWQEPVRLNVVTVRKTSSYETYLIEKTTKVNLV